MDRVFIEGGGFVTVQGLDRVLAKIERLKNINQELVPVVDRSLTYLEGLCKDNASGPRPEHIDKVTANLVGGIQSTGARLEGDSIVGEVESAALYSHIHENGGVISAKNAPMLKWQTPDGQWHQAQSVTIPARPFMAPSLIEGQPAVLKNLQEFVSEVIR